MFLEQAYSGKNQWYLYIFTLLFTIAASQIPLLLLVPNEILLTGDFSKFTNLNTGFAILLSSFVFGFWSLFLCVKFIHRKKCLDIVTARRKIDWGRILFAIGIWGTLNVLGLAIQFATTDTSNIVFQFEPYRFLVLVVISLLMVPFQTSWEELLLRGYLLQWAGILLKYRWAAWLTTSVVFGLLHLSNPEIASFGLLVALPQYILMGLLLGYITIKDDGLELALGLHFINNLFLSLTLTSDSSALQTYALFKDLNPSMSHTDTLLMLIFGVLFIWICNCKYHFMGKVNLWEKIKVPAPEQNSQID